VDFIDQWLKDESHVNVERELTLKDLGTEIESIATDCSVPWQRGNPRSFGQYVRPRAGTLSKLFGMTVRTAHAGMTMVSFKPRRSGDMGDLGDLQSDTLFGDRYVFEPFEV
jgi:hypothetical protein